MYNNGEDIITPGFFYVRKKNGIIPGKKAFLILGFNFIEDSENPSKLKFTWPSNIEFRATPSAIAHMFDTEKNMKIGEYNMTTEQLSLTKN